MFEKYRLGRQITDCVIHCGVAAKHSNQDIKKKLSLYKQLLTYQRKAGDSQLQSIIDESLKIIVLQEQTLRALQNFLTIEIGELQRKIAYVRLTNYLKTIFDLLDRGRSLLTSLIFTISAQKSSLTENISIREKIQKYKANLKEELKIGRQYEALLKELPPNIMDKLRHELFERVQLEDSKSAVEIYVGMGSIAILLVAVIQAGYVSFKPGPIEENFKEMQNTIISLGIISAGLYILKRVIRCLREIQWLRKNSR